MAYQESLMHELFISGRSMSAFLQDEKCLCGITQPAKNIKAANVATNHMLAYSAKKNTANDMPEYST